MKGIKGRSLRHAPLQMGSKSSVPWNPGSLYRCMSERSVPVQDGAACGRGFARARAAKKAGRRAMGFMLTILN